MCTVSFIPLGGTDFILSSNRDINLDRKPATRPGIEQFMGVNLLFPKDGEAGGTWIGAGENNRAVCLLNGAFEMHDWSPPYRKSRGLVVKEALSAKEPVPFFRDYWLEGIEPFTLLMLEWKNEVLDFYQWVWDGEKAHLDPQPIQPSIWSSSPLYTREAKGLREKWFSRWLEKHQARITVEQIRNWHLETGEGDPITDLVTKRGFLETVSLTTIYKIGESEEMVYLDLRSLNESRHLLQ